MKRPKILTFNWHEAYIYLLSKTGFDFDVVQMWKGGRYGWIREFRPVPENCNLIAEEEALENLQQGKYQAVFCHNVHDFTKVSELPVKKIIIHHNNFAVETGIIDKNKKAETLEKLREIYSNTDNLTLVFISEMKKKDWGFDGEIILPGIDLDEYHGYRGDISKALRVGNGLKERDAMLGYSIQERILNGLPSTVLGLNPSIKEAILPDSWDEYREYLRSHRVYLNTTVYPYEDGYNLAMLEAMATGMPVVAIKNPTSPLVDGINGFVSDDEEYLRERLKEMLSDPERAKQIGERARETVREIFPIERFIENWKRVIGEDVNRSYRRLSSSKEKPKERLRILLSYTSNPQTTGFYFERALRKQHEVVTFGPSITDSFWNTDIIKEWRLEKIKDRVKPHDIPYLTDDLSEVTETLKSLKGWEPDMFLYVDSGLWYTLKGLKGLKCPKVCYLIDVHLDLERRIKFARDYDFVFIAQRQYLQDFIDAGIKNVYWLPLGCDPEIHGKRELPKQYDIGFVGSLNNRKRIELINKLSERFNLHYERCFLERMAEVYSQSKIVFNISVNNDMNMRVFEALCSGSMLLTDEATGSGLTELFEDRKHLVVYKNEEELFELADYYLKNEEERERIAEEGYREVLKNHTYAHRVEEIINTVTKGKDKKTDNLDVVSNTAKADLSYYCQERKEVEALVPENAKRILDVGCGAGVLGKKLLLRGAEEVVGVELVPEIAKRADENLSRVLCGDIEKMELPFKEGYFDCIILADILEHLREPGLTLKKLKGYLSQDG
ncbi:MAG: glycosyltransferase, partial [Nitrospirae bacterium]